MKHPSLKCKYFGALTFTVYINTYLSDSNDDAEQIAALIDTLLDNVIELSFANNQFGSHFFVTKKLLSNISLLFISHAHKYDTDPVLQLLYKFNGISPAESIIQSLTEEQLLLILSFNTIIVEDTSKREATSHAIHYKIAKSVFPNLNLLLQYILTSTNVLVPVTLACLNCINSWIIYITIAETSSDQRYLENDVKCLVEILFKQFHSNMIQKDDQVEIIDIKIEVLNKTFAVLTELLETNPTMLNPFKSQLSAIFFDTTQFGYLFINFFVMDKENYECYSTEIENFVNLLIAYLNTNIIHMSRNIMNDDVRHLLEILFTLSSYPGHPILEEKISEQLLLFWEELVNIYVDDSEVLESILKDRLPEFKIKRDELLLRISSIYWQKTHFFNGANNEFVHYRVQVADLFILIYSLLGTTIYSALCESILNKLPQCYDSPTEQSLLDLEASLYLLFKITDDLTFYDDDSTQKLEFYIEKIFNNHLIETVEKSSGSTLNEDHNNQLHITLLNLISSIQFFFKSQNGVKFLTPTFNFLFTIILNGGNLHKNLSLVASKTVLKVCQDSKESLIPFLSNFDLIVNEMIKTVEVDNLIRERMVNAYISIALSLRNPIKQGEVVHKVLLQISEISSKLIEDPSPILSTQLSETQALEQYEEYAISLLSCINEIGKASQLPDEIENVLTPDQINFTNSYWQEDPLQTKSLILQNLEKLSLNSSTLSNSTLITEKSCNILKNGLNEPLDGPFKFSLDVIVNYLIIKIQNCNNASITYIYKLIETIIITNGKHLSSLAVNDLLSRIFTDNVVKITGDVDLIKSSLELFSTILERYPSLIISLEVFRIDIIKLALVGLSYHESFVIKSVIKFWVNFITLKRGRAEDQEMMQNIINATYTDENPLGYTLSQNLICSFLENPRSNLDHFYPMFRNLIGKFPVQFKTWLRLVLINTVGKRNERIDKKYIDQFVGRLMLTRGQRQANDILKRFWLEYNGLVEFRK